MNRDRVMALVLARVVTARAGMTAAEAAKATVRFAPGRDARAWGEQVEQAWGRLVSSGDVTAAGTAATTAHAPWPAFGLRGATPWKRPGPGLPRSSKPGTSRDNGGCLNTKPVPGAQLKQTG